MYNINRTYINAIFKLFLFLCLPGPMLVNFPMFNALSKCLLEEMKEVAIPQGCSPWSAGFRLLQGPRRTRAGRDEGGEDAVPCCSGP